MKKNESSFLECLVVDIVLLMMLILGSIMVTFATSIIFNIPIILHIGRFDWDFKSYVMLVMGVALSLILIDKFRKWAEHQ